MSESFCETKCPYLRAQELRSGGMWGGAVDQSICPRRAVNHLLAYKETLPSTGDPVLPGLNIHLIKDPDTTEPEIVVASMVGSIVSSSIADYLREATTCARLVAVDPDITEDEVLTISPGDFTIKYQDKVQELTRQEEWINRAQYEVN